MNYQSKISSDAPVDNPADDAFGFSSFARNLAKAIRGTPSPNGLVMAINGPWGAGKSSLLNLVMHDLNTVHEAECPIVIEFNPWWFNGRDQLASQLLAQFSIRLRNESATLLKIGELMAEYSGALSQAVALSTGLPWIDKPVNAILKMLKRKPREVPQLKSEIAKLLRNSKRRVLVIIDDLDRLTPDEIREVFKVIKALADFPNLIYLLSFDKNVVAEALGKSLGVDGSAYLEKIVQASFSLPAVDKLRLQQKLFVDLNVLVDSLPMVKFDTTYWGNVYFDGLDAFIAKPRDIVRVVNALAVTYPPVAGEVNPVDFIALEFLRVFQSTVYGVVRDNRDMFTGVLSDSAYQRNDVKDFHEAWLGELDARTRQVIKPLMIRLFPKVESALGNMNYGIDFLGRWRQELRACSADLFDLYFQFSVPDGYLSRAEFTRLLDLSADLPVLVATLKSATKAVRPDGHSKARDIVDRLTQLQDGEISSETAERLLRGIFALDEDLLIAADERGGMMRLPNSWRLNFLLNRLLAFVPEANRAGFLIHCIEGSKAYAAMIDVVSQLATSKDDPEKHRPWMDGIDQAAIDALKAAVLAELEKVSMDELLTTSDTRLILNAWSGWSDPAFVKDKLATVLNDDTQIARMLEKFLGLGSSHAFGDRVARTTYHLDPRSLEPFFELEDLAARVEALLPNLPSDSLSRKAAERYLRGMALLREGKPTGAGVFDHY
ncbi:MULTISPECIES: KAP family P-loop NTPase fold protein [unclassified Variovorax]|uniref:KAP family P-loop NTPase fold protein n=1 Tax=unclassified Variovorax TaxID=663243 RepID=UPI003F460226